MDMAKRIGKMVLLTKATTCKARKTAKGITYGLMVLRTTGFGNRTS